MVTEPSEPPKVLIKAIERALGDRWTAERLHNDSDPEVDAYVALDAIPVGWIKTDDGWLYLTPMLVQGGDHNAR